MLLSLSAHASDCQQEVTRIRMKPAKLISNAEWDKMLAGCQEKKAEDPKWEDTYPLPESNNTAAVQEELNAVAHSQQLTAHLMADTDAEISRIRAQQQPSVSCTSFVFGNAVQTNCN